MSSRRILIIMSQTGGGHRSAALALEEALLELSPEAEVETVDIYAYLPFPLSRVGGLYGPVVQYSQGLWQLLWDLTHTPEKADRLVKVIAPLARPTLRDILRARRPDVVVSVYPLCVHALAQAREDLGLAIPQITVVTDLVNIHPTWACPSVDCCVVPSEPAREQVMAFGIPSERARALGLPVGLHFSDGQQEKQALRAQLNLDAGLRTLLLMGGADGVGPLLETARLLDGSDLPIQLMVVAGHNEKLYYDMAAIAWEKNVRRFGFVRNMWELMRASDLLLTKAGPGTICESLNAGLPMLLIDALPGQEAGNADYVVSSGAGLLVDSPEDLVAQLRSLLVTNPERLEDMKARAMTMARPRAALDIARLILEQVGNGVH